MGIIVKGNQVAFATESASRENPRSIPTPDLRLPPRYGIIHDPKGEKLPRCTVYFGPYKIVRGTPQMTPEARKYFGSRYEAAVVEVSRPNPSNSTWEPVALVTHIFYVRGSRGNGAYAKGAYHHTFARSPLTLDKSGKFYRLSLTPGSPNACIVDDRGFVFP